MIKVIYSALSIQLFLSVIGMILALSFRKNRFLLVVNLLLSIFAGLGFYGINKNSQNFIIAHGYLTGVLGIVMFIYQTIQQVLIKGMHIEILLFLPFLIDAIAGGISLHYINRIWKQSKEASEIPSRIPEENAELTNNLNERLIPAKECCICKEAESTIMIYECGHICLCFNCSRSIIKHTHKCPICRKIIKDMVRIYA